MARRQTAAGRIVADAARSTRTGRLPSAAPDVARTKENIRAAIDATGMTHKELAEWFGVTVSSVDKWTSRDAGRSLSNPAWALLLMLAEMHPTLKLSKRR